MPYVLGVDIGGSNASAAVCRRDGGGWAEATVVRLGMRSTTVESTLYVSATGAVSPEEGARHDAAAGRHASVRGYIRRVGDDVPLMIGTRAYPAHELTAAMIRWIVDRVWDLEGEPAEQVAVACPAGWGPYRKGVLREALESAGLGDVVLVAAPLAATAGHAATADLPASGVFAGYDLGGSGFTGSVVERHNGGGQNLVGLVERPVGGTDLDDALVAHVQSRAGLTRKAGGGGLDGDPELRASRMSWLRGSCTVARERLSTSAEAVVPVPTSSGQIDVVVTRAEFTGLARPLLQPTVDSLVQLIRTGPEPLDPAVVLLAGGASQTPRLAELIAAQLPVPVLADPEPDTVVARGAALAARRVLARASTAVRSHGSWGQA